MILAWRQRMVWKFIPWLTVFFILCLEEERFQNNGIINRHNCNYLSQENLHSLRETNFQVVL